MSATIQKPFYFYKKQRNIILAYFECSEEPDSSPIAKAWKGLCELNENPFADPKKAVWQDMTPWFPEHTGKIAFVSYDAENGIGYFTGVGPLLFQGQDVSIISTPEKLQ